MPPALDLLLRNDILGWDETYDASETVGIVVVVVIVVVVFVVVVGARLLSNTWII